MNEGDPEREATLNYCLDMLQQIGEMLERGGGEPELGCIVRALVKSQRSYKDMSQSAALVRDALQPYQASAA